MSFKDSKAQILANSASDDSDISTMEADLATTAVVDDGYVLCTDGRYVIYDEYYDNSYSTVDKLKNVTVDSSQINIVQETNSQYIPFRIPRYWDGIDLMKMLIQIRYENVSTKKGQVSTAVNVASSTTNITFGWLVDQNVTAIAGDVRFEIMATGSNEKGNTYVWRTRPNGRLTVLEGLNYDGIVEPSDDWYTGFVTTIMGHVNEAKEYADQAKASAASVDVNTIKADVKKSVTADVNANLAENYYNKTEIDTKVRELNDAIGGIDSLKNLKVDYDNTTGRLVFKDGTVILKTITINSLSNLNVTYAVEGGKGKLIFKNGETEIQSVELSSIEPSAQWTAALKEEINTGVDTKISPVSEKVNAVESSVTDLSKKVEINTSDITALKTKTKELEKADEAIRSTASEAKNTADILKQNIADYDSQFNTINGDITNIQADIDEIKKNPAASEYDVDYVGSTFSWMKNGEVLKTFTIQSGGGGGSDTSTITIERVTPADAIFLLGDKAEIEYTFSSVDNTGDTTGDGTAIWKVGNTIVSTTTASQGTNKVDLTEYLSVGSNQIRVSITDTVKLSIDGKTVSTLTVDRTAQVWSFKSSEVGQKNLTISCQKITKILTAHIEKLDIDVNPITTNLAFDFNPVGLSNGDENRLWSDENHPEVALTVSDNFDWTNGGYQIDDEGNQYFCVKAGTTASISYNLFAKDPKQTGAEFKIIFKTKNVRNASATFLSCLDGLADSNIGLEMKVHEANIYTSTDDLYFPYSEEDIIEYEYNINSIDTKSTTATSIIMTYEDGVGGRPIIYDNSHRLHQYTPAPISIGSPDCDVLIYRIKAYSAALTDSDVLSNFIADARNSDDMIDRYNRIRSSGGSWISARNNVAVRGTATGKDSWNPVVGQATPNGYWTIGNLASNDNLAFSYTSNTNYNAGNNSATTVYLPVQEGTIITSATIGSQSVKYATSAGSAGSVAWGNVSGKPSSYTPSSHTHDDRYYTETEINTKLGTKLGAVSANGYYGMARPDGNTSDWIRTTTAGIIPYQSGGAGGGHCGLGTSSWYFSNAYIDTVNCVNASVSGHIDVGGYIQSSNLINTYFEYQSNRGSVDWRFGAATGTSDENFFGFYDAKTGKIPLALDGNFGNIYVGFNVGSYESPTAVGVYLGGQVAGNRAFIYNGDSYQGSIWIQTRLDGSWKWFSLGRACSTALSDIRLKGNIRDTEVEDATKVIESMKIRSFERKDSHKKYKIGFIADELEQLDPNLVDGGGEVDGHPYYKSVNNLQMLAYVVKGMQELNSKVTILEKENKRLKQKLNMCN